MLSFCEEYSKTQWCGLVVFRVFSLLVQTVIRSSRVLFKSGEEIGGGIYLKATKKDELEVELEIIASH